MLFGHIVFPEAACSQVLSAGDLPVVEPGALEAQCTPGQRVPAALARGRIRVELAAVVEPAVVMRGAVQEALSAQSLSVSRFPTLADHAGLHGKTPASANESESNWALHLFHCL